jgi:L-ascorbate metabolism protein UlaG (beta-lactamase superfamily)
MFDIEFKGANCVVISTKKSTLVTDPKLTLVGLKDQVIKGAVELATEERFALKSVDAQLSIDSPGEYEVGDFSIRGQAAIRHIDAKDDEKVSTIYRIEIGDIRIALLGNVASNLTEDQLEFLGVVDILIVPIGGGGYTLDATSAAAAARQIDPKVVIPVHYADQAVKYEVPQDTLEIFTKELGVEVETTSKLKVKSQAALPQALTVVVISRS